MTTELGGIRTNGDVNLLNWPAGAAHEDFSMYCIRAAGRRFAYRRFTYSLMEELVLAQAAPSPLLRQLSWGSRVPGMLLLSSMPGRLAPWAEFQDAVERRRVGLILCLTGPEEIAAKSPDYAAALKAGTLRPRWQAHAVADFGTPDDAYSFAHFLAAGGHALQAGEAVLLHCAAGIGRTGGAALCLLHLIGVPQAEADAQVVAAGSHPETPAQQDFVVRFRAAQSPGRIPAA
jgi:hypothetical protein